MSGQITLIGAGPGDPDLITLKALKRLQQADIVLHDRLVSPGVLDLIPAGTPRIFAGKSCKIHYMAQTETNAVMVSLAQQGKHVVRLKGGDPFIFGRGGEEIEAAFHAGIPFEIIPGISAAAGCAAALALPLTHRDYCYSVRAITGHFRASDAKNIDWRGLSDPETTLVIYMGLASTAMIAENLLHHGRAAQTPSVAISRGTTPDQREVFSPLAKLAQAVAEAGLESPALLIIGEVVALSQKLKSGLFLP